MDASTTTFKKAVCGRKYRKASWVCFVTMSLSQLSGIDAINVYANRLLVQMEEQGGSFPITPTQGTYLIGACNAIPSLLALITIQLFGRRTIYIYGQFFMGACLCSAGLCALYEWNLASFISLCCLVAGY